MRIPNAKSTFHYNSLLHFLSVALMMTIMNIDIALNYNGLNLQSVHLYKNNILYRMHNDSVELNMVRA